jgi:DNA ligase D-like protein (predicted ligase)
MPLPAFVAPMLATLIEEPFDSERHLFEIKWDGIRALAFVEGPGDVRVLSRNRQDLKPAYPELACLAGLPAGTLLDGELVVLVDGRPDFSRSLERVQVRGGARAQALARTSPAAYVVFDLLYLAGRSQMGRRLTERRAALQELLASAQEPRLSFSDGVVGPGRKFFEEARERRLEGVVAKELDGSYLAGKRTRSWCKIKTTRTAPCAILGYVPDERGELASLVVAMEEGGELRCVGRVGSGLSDALRTRLLALCRAHPRSTPFVAAPEGALWVEPGLYCTVSFLERTTNGLRAPVFVELIEER